MAQVCHCSSRMAGTGLLASQSVRDSASKDKQGVMEEDAHHCPSPDAVLCPLHTKTDTHIRAHTMTVGCMLPVLGQTLSRSMWSRDVMSVHLWSRCWPCVAVSFFLEQLKSMAMCKESSPPFDSWLPTHVCQFSAGSHAA